MASEGIWRCRGALRTLPWAPRMPPEHSQLISDVSLIKQADTVVPNACTVEPRHCLAMKIRWFCSLLEASNLSLLRFCIRNAWILPQNSMRQLDRAGGWFTYTGLMHQINFKICWECPGGISEAHGRVLRPPWRSWGPLEVLCSKMHYIWLKKKH